MMGRVRQYSEAGRAGCVQLRRSKRTGTMVGIYHTAQAEMDDDPKNPWVTVCEDHGTFCTHAALRDAREHAPDVDWCEACQKKLERGVKLRGLGGMFRVGRTD